MATPQQDIQDTAHGSEGTRTQPHIKRRGLIAGAAALMAGLVATQAAQQSVSADQGTWTLPYTGTVSTAGDAVQITNSGANSGRAIHGTSDAFDGIAGYTNGAAGNAGVYGLANSTGTYGVHGNGNLSGYGLFGERGVIGVYGLVNSYIGTANTIGVFGNNAGTGANGIGVYGASVKGAGVYGVTNATSQYGVLGTTTAVSSTAIAGIANTDGSSAFSGGTANPNAFAGVFQGTVVVQGKLVVSDPSYKSGALLHPDGSHRLVYCVESPESWIEDFGTGHLVNGKADVLFDADFAAVVHTDNYHVFLTSHDPASKGLAVAALRADGFTVQEHGGGTSTQTFSWRAVAKPKSQVKQERLAKFTMPSLKLPDSAAFTTPPEPVTPPGKR